MEFILHSVGQQFVTALREGGSKQHRRLNVGHRLKTRKTCREHATRLFGRESLTRYHQQKRPRFFDIDLAGVEAEITNRNHRWPAVLSMTGRHFLPLGDSKATQPAGGNVIVVPFAPGGLSHKALNGPTEIAKMPGESSTCKVACRRDTPSHANRH